MTITPDARFEYLEGIAALLLRFKPDKWGKLLGAEESLALFTEFFDKPDVLVLVLTLNTAGMIVPCLGFPAALKTKGVYFIKKKPENISKTNIKGLPSLDSSLLHAIETIVIDWSHQIRDVLSKDSAQALLDGMHPLPRVEFEFWDTRLMNLQCIHDQLNRPKVNRIVEILEKAQSCYWPALQNVYLNVTDGLKEANDIVLHLKPLRILLEEMEQADFTALPTFIAKVLYTICLIWANSKHYNTPSRVIVILQEFCNQVMDMTRTYLGPDEVLKGLQGEIEEVLNGISLSVSVLKGLYRTYQFCCANMKLFFKVPSGAAGSGRAAQDKEPVPWEFPSSLAFSRMNSFFRRIQTIEDLYKTAIEFLKLEKIELGGVRGSILGSLVVQIHEEVFELVKVFIDCKYDPLDPEDSSFDNDYADFETKIQDLDRRLATIFCQAFDDGNFIESCAKHGGRGALEQLLTGFGAPSPSDRPAAPLPPLLVLSRPVATPSFYRAKGGSHGAVPPPAERDCTFFSPVRRPGGPRQSRWDSISTLFIS
ncbi:Dynein heavy chain 17, axonemal [Myotis davidii]|uniref:Dynein heavy chain 17, axonemal n=1 Tax=Myotis davidii TaxID=225400 RepID=L5MI30_MYODS|nr:Dynein heavy chain 17, axonemal [Myotis davidii]